MIFDLVFGLVCRFQEIVDLNAGSLLIEHDANQPWEVELEKAMQHNFPDAQYQQVIQPFFRFNKINT